VFGTVPGEVAVGVVADPLRRGRIQVDVGVLAPGEPGAHAACCLSANPTRDKSMNPLVTSSGYTGPRVLAVKSTPAERTRLTCYSGRALTLNWLIGPGAPGDSATRPGGTLRLTAR
jgi:hypothetical protein